MESFEKISSDFVSIWPVLSVYMRIPPSSGSDFSATRHIQLTFFEYQCEIAKYLYPKSERNLYSAEAVDKRYPAARSKKP